MNNKIIIAIIIVAVVVIGGYFLFKSMPQPAPSVSQQPSPQSSLGTDVPSGRMSAEQAPITEKNAVIYTDAGYSPITLQIKKGETVTFKNQSSQSMWTASNAHPTHLLYPTTGGCLGSTFDACQGIEPGASWSFRFYIAGTWKYHNHLNPSDTGAIVVE